MNELSLRLPNNIVLGTDALGDLTKIVKEYGTRALIVSESALHDAHYIDRVSGLLRGEGLDVIIYDELRSSSTTSVVDEIAALAKASRTSVVVGLGGMRVLSTARCVANVAAGDVNFQQLSAGQLPKNPVAYVEVASSFRNHLMMRPEAILRDAFTGGPVEVAIHPETTRAVLIDTSFSQSLSNKYAMAAIVDTLLASVEAYASRRSTFFSDALLERAFPILQEAAKSSARNPAELRYRHKAAQASVLAAMAMSQVPQGAGGALSYAMNARFQLPKSWVAAIVLPHVVDNLIPVAPEKMVGYAKALGEPVEGIIAQEEAHRAARATRKIVSQLDLPARFRELDVELEDLLETAEMAASLAMVRNATIPVSATELQTLIKTAY